MKKVILFDFDGTIADSFENFLGIIKTLSEKYGLPMPSRAELEKLRDEEPRAILKQLRIPFYKLPLLARDMKKLQHEKITEIHPFSDLPEALQELKAKGYTLGILTSNGEENVRSFLKKHNLELFEYIYSNSSLFGKAASLEKFLKQTSFSRDDVLYVGDEIRDIQACQKVGIKIIAVTWGFNSQTGLMKYHPDYLIHSPQELLTTVSD